MGRRLRHSLEYCLQINAELRGLPWPPPPPPPSQESGEAAVDPAQANTGGDILAIQGGSDQWETEDQVVPGEDHEEEEETKHEEEDTPTNRKDKSESMEIVNKAEFARPSEGFSSSVDEEMTSRGSKSRSSTTSVALSQSTNSSLSDEGEDDAKSIHTIVNVSLSELDNGDKRL